MRHGDKINNLSRTASHRKALLSNLSCQLFQYKKIVTTLAKAKALRVYVEPIITKAKENTTHRRRLVFSLLQDKVAVKELFDVIGPKVGGRPGGYTRVIKLGARVGDNAELALIELVDYNEIYGKGIGETETGVKKTRRAGRSKKATAITETATEVKSETKHAEEPKAKKESAKSDVDDLTKIEGIGPKAAEVFHNEGITTFAQMAKKTGDELKEMLEKSGGHFNALDTHSWPEQAQLAADGNWDGLKELQDKLTAGRE